MEGGTAPFDVCDVLVADGFTGNIYLKCVEGIGKFLLKRVKGVFLSSTPAKLAALALKKPLYEMKKARTKTLGVVQTHSGNFFEKKFPQDLQKTSTHKGMCEQIALKR